MTPEELHQFFCDAYATAAAEAIDEELLTYLENQNDQSPIQ